jgi:predicted RNA-binding protein YlxR (DUF448 family)
VGCCSNGAATGKILREIFGGRSAWINNHMEETVKKAKKKVTYDVIRKIVDGRKRIYVRPVKS